MYNVRYIWLFSFCMKTEAWQFQRHDETHGWKVSFTKGCWNTFYQKQSRVCARWIFFSLRLFRMRKSKLHLYEHIYLTPARMRRHSDAPSLSLSLFFFFLYFYFFPVHWTPQPEANVLDTTKGAPTGTIKSNYTAVEFTRLAQEFTRRVWNPRGVEITNYPSATTWNGTLPISIDGETRFLKSKR